MSAIFQIYSNSLDDVIRSRGRFSVARKIFGRSGDFVCVRARLPQNPPYILSDEETNLMTSADVSKIKEQLKSEKHACLYVRLEHPRDFKVLK